jgi:hypothetical protein
MYDETVLYAKPLEEQYARKSITCSILIGITGSAGKYNLKNC